ncbi:hypothetical protein PHLH8_20990 [Pseudomonas sp. Pc102]|uniref:hypothetical protein n=1 Tax=Pseudomonas sp. Pc102 TaxID=2678261 RepID=UPI001BCFD6BD|nr:hypothetical protein [Pseudomonas sp. Pc102]BBP82457.1 hypothetical protein PHLH8_20990 [Pseudomonas sp. Pc102]
MAQIPLGRFAAPNVVPTPEQGRVVTGPDSTRGLQQVAATAMNVGSDILDRQNRENQALARVKASNAIIDRESQLKAISSDIEEKMRTGQLEWDKGEEAYNAAASKLDPLQVTGLDPVGQGELANSLKRLQVGGLDRIRAATLNARVDSAKADIASRMDMLGKDAALPGADISQINARMDVEDIDLVGRMGYGEKWDAMKQAFKDENWATQATQRVIGARDGLGELEQIRTDLTSADSIYARNLSPDKRNQLLNTVTGRIYQVQAHQQQQAMARDMKAMRTLAQMDKQAATGIPPSPAEQQAWQASLAGTSFAGEYNDRIEQMNQVQQVLRLPLDQQQAFIQNQRTQLATEGGSVAQATNLNRLETAITENIKRAREEPLVFSAMRTGTQVEPLKLEGIATPDGQASLLAQLSERFDTVAAVRQQFGPDVQLVPFLPQEAELLKAAIPQMDDNTKLQVLGTLSAAAPTSQAYKGALTAIAADDPNLMLAGLAQHNDLKGPPDAKTGQSVNVAQTILTGSKVLKDKSYQLPSEKEMRVAFDDAVGASIPVGTPQREQAFGAYRAIYAGLAQSRGISAEDASLGGMDRSLAEETALLATGGVGERGGAKVIKPYGMSDRDFDDAVDKQLQGLAEGSGISIDQLEDMPLMKAPGSAGSYYLLNGTGPQLNPKTNEPMVVIIQ